MEKTAKVLGEVLSEDPFAHCPAPELCTQVGSDDADIILLGLVLSFAAGLATTGGALLAFLPCIEVGNKKWLVVGLGISGGVMLYVSFLDLMPNSLAYFCCYSKNYHVVTATASFFAGIFLTICLDNVLHWLGSLDNDNPCLRIGCMRDSKRQVQDEEATWLEETTPLQGTTEGDDEKRQMVSILSEGASPERMRHMGIMTGLAMALHNFPEGVATFMATIAQPQIGFALAFAIALHNIPEGIAVSLPIYYATGSKVRAFFWATLSGMAEPLGAFLAWIILRDYLRAEVFGAIFGFVGGMMVYITIHELIPMAHKFDPTDKHVSIPLIMGMAIMAVSILLFDLM